MSSASHLPACVGVGFKPQHFHDILAAPQPVGFFEVHAENYMGAGGPPHAQLGALRGHYALSIHGVGLSIGSMDRSTATISRGSTSCATATCRKAFRSISRGRRMTASISTIFCRYLIRGDARAGRGAYRRGADGARPHDAARKSVDLSLSSRDSTIPETDFLAELSRRTGCGSAARRQQCFCFRTNNNMRRRSPIWTRFRSGRVGEIHLGGHHAEGGAEGPPLLIDATARRSRTRCGSSTVT